MIMLFQSDILRCPWAIIATEHYFENGDCRCYDETHLKMNDWGYKWDGEKWIENEDFEEN